MKLYDRMGSGNCYKVHLFAAFTGIELVSTPVDTAAGEQKTQAFRSISPFQHIPALQDASIIVWDSQAILVYLAKKFDMTHWWPDDAVGQAHVTSWLSVATNEVWHGPARARAIAKKGSPGDLQAALALTGDLLPRLDRHLANETWFATGRPTVADCAMFPYLAMAPVGGVDLGPFPSLRAWLNRVIGLPGFLPHSDVSTHY